MPRFTEEDKQRTEKEFFELIETSRSVPINMDLVYCYMKNLIADLDEAKELLRKYFKLPRVWIENPDGNTLDKWLQWKSWATKIRIFLAEEKEPEPEQKDCKGCLITLEGSIKNMINGFFDDIKKGE